MDYIDLYSSESFGGDGSFGIKIMVSSKELPDLKDNDIWIATNKAQEIITSAIKKKIKELSPRTQIETENNRKLIDDVFELPIFIEEIPNGYCKDWCCYHLPWFIVTTKVGRIKIGWRKRVISIDWSETVGTLNSEELFKDVKDTKGFKSIHAWSIEDAKKYIKSILTNQPI